MNVEATAKPKLVSAHQLSHMVEDAVASASLRLPAASSGDLGHNVILSPDILGRVLRDLDQAQHFAQAVTKGVEKAGIGAEPVVLPIGKGLHIAGFIERDALQFRQF
jgi:hypothetical protein